MIDLLINIFSKFILSLNFKTEIFLNKELVLKVHNSKCFFFGEITRRLIALEFEARKRESSS